jgi:Methyltransferase domain
LAHLFIVGTGLLTRYLCNSLKERDDVVVQYVVSDVSFALANSTVKSTGYKYASAKTFDLTKHPSSQGFSSGCFDIIVGCLVLHATPDISTTLSHIRQLLVGGGSLAVIELNKNTWQNLMPSCIFHDFVFGSFPEWFVFNDGRDHCSLLPEEWAASLQGTGYEGIQTSVYDGMEFIFTARKAPFDGLSSPRLGFASPVFLTYKYGQEMELQREISRLDVNQHLFLWLLASDGVDGAASMGMAQSLLKEFTTWEIHAAIFEGTQDETERINLVLQYQEYLSDDTTIRFTKDGLPHAFKIVPAPPPVSKHSTWTDQSLGDVIPLLQEKQVAVDISFCSGTFSSWKGFVGHIRQTKVDGFSVGDLVLGVVADAPESNLVVCHAGQLALIPSEMKTAGIAEYAIPMVIAAITLGPSCSSRSGPQSPPVEIFLAAGDELSHISHSFLKLLHPLAHAEIDEPSSDTEFDWVVVDSSTALQRPEVAFWRGKMLIWDTVMRDMCQARPWSLGDSLKTILPLISPVQSTPRWHITHPKDQDPSSSRSKVSNPLENMLFNWNKSYVLIGGASDLGVHIALWMYEVSGTPYMFVNAYQLFVAAWCSIYCSHFTQGSEVLRRKCNDSY